MIIESELLVNEPLVSVVIPSYNRCDLVGKTINSILNQKCDFDFELIIGDDCSNDGVRDVLLEFQKEHPERIKLIFHEKNIGLGANWAYCVKSARGVYVANCDNDDYWHCEQKLQLQVDFLNSNSQVGVCHTFYRNYKNGKFIERKIDSSKLTEPLYAEIVNLKHFECCNSSILYRKEIIDKYVKLDDYILQQFAIQDWNTWVILAHYTEFYCLPVSTTTVFLDNDSITRNTDYSNLTKRLLKQEGTTKYMHNLFPDLITYSEESYLIYIKLVLLNLSMKKLDYRMAKTFSLELRQMNYTGERLNITENIFIFYMFCAIKRIRLFLSPR